MYQEGIRLNSGAVPAAVNSIMFLQPLPLSAIRMMGRPQKLSKPEDLPIAIQYSKLSGEKAWNNQSRLKQVISAVLHIVIVLKHFKIIT